MERGEDFQLISKGLPYLFSFASSIQTTMLSRKNVLAVACAALLGLTSLQSCSNKATEEQMKALGALDHQRDGLRNDIQAAQDRLKDVQGRLAVHDRDLSDCNLDTQAAKDGLTRWPNIWADSADWRVAPPPAPAPEPMTKGKKKKHA